MHREKRRNTLDSQQFELDGVGKQIGLKEEAIGKMKKLKFGGGSQKEKESTEYLFIFSKKTLLSNNNKEI